MSAHGLWTRIHSRSTGTAGIALRGPSWGSVPRKGRRECCHPFAELRPPCYCAPSWWIWPDVPEIHRPGQGHHDLRIPSGLTAHLIVAQAHLPCGCIQGLFDRLMGANRPKDHIVRQFCRLAENAPHQEPTAPALADLPGTQALPFPQGVRCGPPRKPAAVEA
jgi:hypothetical protein